MRFGRCALAALVFVGALVTSLTPGMAQPPLRQPALTAATMEDFDRDVFFFGGRFHEGYVTQTFIPWAATFEDNYIVGGGYQEFFYRWGFVRLGGEIGVSDRFSTIPNPSYGVNNSGEAWAGLVARFDGWQWGPLRVVPSMTAGLSVVSGLIGVEAQRASAINYSGNVLFYLGPELAFSLPEQNPNLEVFVRGQHRSGGFGTIANLDGANADVIGLRLKF